MARYVKNDINYHSNRNKISITHRNSETEANKNDKSFRGQSSKKNTTAWDTLENSTISNYDAWDEDYSKENQNCSSNQVAPKSSKKNHKFVANQEETFHPASSKHSDWDDYYENNNKDSTTAPTVNVWEKRLAHYNEVKMMEPSTENEEEQMMKRALEMSINEASKDKERQRELQEEYDLQMHLLETNPDLFKDFIINDDPNPVSATKHTEGANSVWDEDWSNESTNNKAFGNGSKHQSASCKISATTKIDYSKSESSSKYKFDLNDANSNEKWEEEDTSKFKNLKDISVNKTISEQDSNWIENSCGGSKNGFSQSCMSRVIASKDREWDNKLGKENYKEQIKSNFKSSHQQSNKSEKVAHHKQDDWMADDNFRVPKCDESKPSYLKDSAKEGSILQKQNVCLNNTISEKPKDTNENLKFPSENDEYNKYNKVSKEKPLLSDKKKVFSRKTNYSSNENPNENISSTDYRWGESVNCSTMPNKSTDINNMEKSITNVVGMFGGWGLKPKSYDKSSSQTVVEAAKDIVSEKNTNVLQNEKVTLKSGNPNLGLLEIPNISKPTNVVMDIPYNPLASSKDELMAFRPKETSVKSYAIKDIETVPFSAKETVPELVSDYTNLVSKVKVHDETLMTEQSEDIVYNVESISNSYSMLNISRDTKPEFSETDLIFTDSSEIHSTQMKQSVPINDYDILSTDASLPQNQMGIVSDNTLPSCEIDKNLKNDNLFDAGGHPLSQPYVPMQNSSMYPMMISADQQSQVPAMMHPSMIPMNSFFMQQMMFLQNPFFARQMQAMALYQFQMPVAGYCQPSIPVYPIPTQDAMSSISEPFAKHTEVVSQIPPPISEASNSQPKVTSHESWLNNCFEADNDNFIPPPVARSPHCTTFSPSQNQEGSIKPELQVIDELPTIKSEDQINTADGGWGSLDENSGSACDSGWGDLDAKSLSASDSGWGSDETPKTSMRSSLQYDSKRAYRQPASRPPFSRHS